MTKRNRNKTVPEVGPSVNTTGGTEACVDAWRDGWATGQCEAFEAVLVLIGGSDAVSASKIRAEFSRRFPKQYAAHGAASETNNHER